MTTHDQQQRVATRGHILKATAATGAGLALAGAASRGNAFAASRASAAPGQESILDIITTALIAERLATTFYYTGLTTKAVVATPNLAGAAGDPNNVGSDGNEGNVAYFQAALDQENKHAMALAAAGAKSPLMSFYFPATTF